MRILQIIQKKQLRGAEIFACQLSQHLVELGHTVKIIALFEGPDEMPFTSPIEIVGANKKNRFIDFKAYKKIAAIVSEFRPDIVQANASDSLKYAAFSKLLYRWEQPLAFRNASMISHYIKSTATKWANTFFMKQVSLVLSVSKTTKNDFITLFPFLKDKTFVLPIGVEKKQVEWSQLEPQQTKPLIHVGGFSFEKNHQELIEIFSKVVDKHPNEILWLVGDGPLLTSIQEIVSKKGLIKNVFFWGNRKDVPQLLSQAKALLLTSKIEGLPAVILEAFYYNLPVIAYNVGAIGELVKNNETGFLIPLNDSTAFCNAIENLKELGDLERIRKQARELVMEKYTNEKVALDASDIYKSLN